MIRRDQVSGASFLKGYYCCWCLKHACKVGDKSIGKHQNKFNGQLSTRRGPDQRDQSFHKN